MDIGTQDDDYTVVTKPDRVEEPNPYELPQRETAPAEPVEVPSK